METERTKSFCAISHLASLFSALKHDRENVTQPQDTDIETKRNRWKEAPCLFLTSLPLCRKVERGPQQPQTVKNYSSAQSVMTFAIFNIFLID